MRLLIKLMFRPGWCIATTSLILCIIVHVVLMHYYDYASFILQIIDSAAPYVNSFTYVAAWLPSPLTCDVLIILEGPDAYIYEVFWFHETVFCYSMHHVTRTTLWYCVSAAYLVWTTLPLWYYTFHYYWTTGVEQDLLSEMAFYLTACACVLIFML